MACLPSSCDSTITYCNLSARTASTASSYSESTWMTSATRPRMRPCLRGSRSWAFIMVRTPILYPSKFSVRDCRLAKRDWQTLRSASADLSSDSMPFLTCSNSSQFMFWCSMDSLISRSRSAVASLAKLFRSEALIMVSILSLKSCNSFSRRDRPSVI